MKQTGLPKGIKAKELLALLPLEGIDAIAQRTNVNRHVKKLFGKDMFLLMLLAVLDSERISLRVMEDLYASNKFHFFSNAPVSQKTKHTSLADRLAHIQVNFFEQLFTATYDIFMAHFKPSVAQQHAIMRFDSTCISASAKLLHDGMVNGLPNRKTNRHTKKQVKFTLGFNGLLPATVRFYNQQKHLGEDAPLGETILSYTAAEDDIMVFDRGLKKRTTFRQFTDQQKLFVTRINPTRAYKVIYTHQKVVPAQTGLLEMMSDEWVYLFHNGKRKLTTPFRLIKAKRIEDNQELFFLTNHPTLEATAITEIYKCRWDIEVFFRFLKQELNLKHFLSYNANGIQSMLYVQLIASMLILVYKKLNNIDGYKRAKTKFIQAIDTELTRLIVQLCDGDPDKTPLLNSS